MITIGVTPKAAYWADLANPSRRLEQEAAPDDGQWIRVRALTRQVETAVSVAAFRAVPVRDQDEAEEVFQTRAIAAFQELGFGDLLGKLGVEATASAVVDALQLRALGRALLLDWAGITDEEGEALPFEPTLIAPAMDNPAFAAAFNAAIRAPFARLGREKNGSAPLANISAPGVESDAGDAASQEMPAARADASSIQ
ncbi:MAG: hypothetical protein ACQRW7_11335 [Caulobacterales bacterium]|uniref:hypothetical protein n=1 Tax=Glycocaulis sp. TaxID=1969725 RepID=UPI003FA15C0F